MLSAVMATLVVYGPINWIATAIFVDNKLFEEVRTAIQRLGKWCENRGHHILADKLDYLPNCPMCMGVWIGLGLAGVLELFGLPLPVASSFWPLNVLLNGLLIKAIGHLYYQLSALVHWSAEHQKARALAEQPAASPRPVKIVSTGPLPRRVP